MIAYFPFLLLVFLGAVILRFSIALIIHPIFTSLCLNMVGLIAIRHIQHQLDEFRLVCCNFNIPNIFNRLITALYCFSLVQHEEKSSEILVLLTIGNGLRLSI